MPNEEGSGVGDGAKGPMIIGYAHKVELGEGDQAILDGAHLIIWSFLHFEITSNAEDDLSH